MSINVIETSLRNPLCSITYIISIYIYIYIYITVIDITIICVICINIRHEKYI